MFTRDNTYINKYFSLKCVFIVNFKKLFIKEKSLCGFINFEEEKSELSCLSIQL